MDDIIVIDDFLSHDELVKVTSRSTYKNEDWTIHKSWDDSHQHPLNKVKVLSSNLQHKDNPPQELPHHV